MRSIKLVLFFSILLNNVYAYEPTLDALLRNGSNADIATNTVAANLIITEIDGISKKPLINETGISNKFALKFVLFNERENSPKLTQVNYKGGLIANGTLVNHTERSFSSIVGLMPNNENLDAQIFYSVMASLLNNRSNLLIETMLNLNLDVKKNKELVNKEKLALLRSYKLYLDKLKEGTNELIENPLKPEDEEKREQVVELKKQGFLMRDPLVKRVKIDENFYWIVETDNIYIKFSYDHKIRELRIKTVQGTMEFVFGKFRTFGSQLIFPEFIWIKDSLNMNYKLNAKSLRMFSDSEGQHRKRLKLYRNYAEQNQIVDDIVKPGFIL